MWYDSVVHLLDAEVWHHHRRRLILPGVRLSQHGAEQGAEGSQHLVYIIFNIVLFYSYSLLIDAYC